jgi:hypothetical protein
VQVTNRNLQLQIFVTFGRIGTWPDEAEINANSDDGEANQSWDGQDGESPQIVDLKSYKKSSCTYIECKKIVRLLAVQYYWKALDGHCRY